VSDHDDPRINPRELAAFLAPGSTLTPDGRGPITTLSAGVGAIVVAVLLPPSGFRAAFKNRGPIDGFLVLYEVFLLAVIAATVWSSWS
jgi:hypothetical protein